MNQAATRKADDLVRRSVQGDQAAFEALVRQHQAEILRFFRRTCVTDEDARDMCQQTFIRAYGNLAGFQMRASFRTWLFRIATNLGRNYHRDRGRRPEVPLTYGAGPDGGGDRERDVPDDRQPHTLDVLEHGESRSILRRAVQTLPPRQRSVVIWRVYHDLTFAEIAQVEEITTNNAKVSYCHAVRNLKKALAGTEAAR